MWRLGLGVEEEVWLGGVEGQRVRRGRLALRWMARVGGSRVSLGLGGGESRGGGAKGPLLKD